MYLVNQYGGSTVGRDVPGEPSFVTAKVRKDGIKDQTDSIRRIQYLVLLLRAAVEKRWSYGGRVVSSA